MKKTYKYLLLVFAMIFSVSLFFGNVTAVNAAQANFDYDYDEINSNMSSIAEYFAGMTDNEIQYYIDNYVGMQKKAFESYEAVKDGIGEYSETEDCKIKENENSIIATANVKYEKATLKMEIEFQSISGGATPVSITFSKTAGNADDSDNTSFGEKMKNAGMNTLLGMGTVVIVLVFLSFVISLFSFIHKFEEKMKNKNNASTNAPAQAKVEETSDEDEELIDDYELVAVITAAIAATENTSSDGFVVRSIKRVPNSKWKNA